MFVVEEGMIVRSDITVCFVVFFYFYFECWEVINCELVHIFIFNQTSYSHAEGWQTLNLLSDILPICGWKLLYEGTDGFF